MNEYLLIVKLYSNQHNIVSQAVVHKFSKSIVFTVYTYHLGLSEAWFVDGHQCFRGTCCLHLQCKRGPTLYSEDGNSRFIQYAFISLRNYTPRPSKKLQYECPSLCEPHACSHTVGLAVYLFLTKVKLSQCLIKH